MKRKALLIGAVVSAALLGGGWALAQSNGPGFGPPFMWGQGPAGMGPGMMMGRGMGPGWMHHRGAMGPGWVDGRRGLALSDPARIEALKSELAITPAQEPGWTKYVKALQDAAAAIDKTRSSVDRDAVSRMSPSERYAFVTRMREEWHKQLASVDTAEDELLATLDQAQKAKAEDILPELGFGHGPMRGAFMGGWYDRYRNR